MSVSCECGWTYDGRNGLGLAAQHHDRTGHEVQVEQTICVIYGESTPEVAGQMTVDEAIAALEAGGPHG